MGVVGDPANEYAPERQSDKRSGVDSLAIYYIIMKIAKTVSSILLVVVFIAPMIGAYLPTIGQDADTSQYAGLQWAVMGVYNLPFFIASFVSLLAGDSLYKQQKTGASIAMYMVSILSSTIGTVLMLLWGLGYFA